jgi:alpha-1,6-mannosyltransferase
MKVLNATEFYSERGGGVRSHLTQKGHISCQLGHEHIVVAPGPRDSDERLTGEPLRVGGAAPRIIRIAGPPLPYDGTYHLLWRVDKLRSIAMRESPDVLEIDSPYAAAAACLSVPRRYFGVRTFVWHADFIDTYLRVMLERRARLSAKTATFLLEPLWSMVRRIAARCDATFVAAKWIEEKLRFHGVERVLLLPFGVERRAFSPFARSDSVRSALLGDLSHVPGAALLVGVGRFAVEKRWDVVLQAFEMVQRDTPSVLTLFGDGPERPVLEAHARRLGGSVRFMGFERDRTKLAAALASADVLVHGCPYETFGFAVAEAMSAGLPQVVPNEGGAAELADGASSERYLAGDAAACARAIRKMLARVRRDRHSLQRDAVRAASKIPGVRDQFETTYETYARLLRDRRSP